MRRFVNRGVGFVLLLALMAGLTPAALAQNAETEPEQEVLTTPEENEELPPEENEELPPEEPEPVLTQVGTFCEGMIRVTDGTHWGYASPDGMVLIPVQFDAAEDFELGVARVTLNGKVGLLHWNGSFLFEPEYDELNEVGYGLYLGCRGSVWDLLTTAKASGAEEDTHCLYSDLVSARVSQGANGQLILQEQGGKTTRVFLRNLPQWLKSKKVSGWQFPLYTTERAAFVDVAGREWYDRWVNLVYSTGMMEGTGNQKFDPNDELTVAQTLRLAACLESRAIQDDFHLQSVGGTLWYSPSVTYCEAVGIISYGEYGKDDFDRPITRAEMARIFSRTSAVRSMEIVNDLERVRTSIPDVKKGDYAAEAIYGLFAKGVFTGRDTACSFHPSENLTRAEAATVIARITRPEHRITLWK